MNKLIRFGRRLNLPSTRQIIHEMRMLEAEENRQKERLAARPALVAATSVAKS